MPSVLTPAGAESSPGIVPASIGIQTLTGNVTASGSGSVVATIANSAVTLAKIANAAANSKLLGSGSAGSGSAYAELTLGTNLSMSGTTLNASGGGSGITELTGDVTAGPGSGSQAATITPTTGSGNFVKATSPTLVTPILGTPTSGNLSNCTALPVGSVTGLGTGVSTFLATPTSANLRGALTDETGGGAAVFATGPTLSAPVMTSLVSGSGTVTFPGYTGQVPIVVKSSGTSASTSSLTEFNLAVANIPALAANDMLEIRALFTFTGTAGAKTPVIRHNTSSAATTGGTNLAIVATAANILSARYLYQIQNANSVSVQVANFGVGYGTSTTTNTAGSINTGSASFINFNALVANGGDAAILVSYSVTIYPGV